MIVEPAPTNPRSPIRRTLRLVGIAVPVMLLVGIVAAGALGPQRAPVASPDPSAVAVTNPDDGERPAILADGTTTTFPATWIGFRVRSVTETRAERQDGGADGILAVAGYLSYGDLTWTCVDAYLEATARCDGRALLADVDVLPTDDNGGVFAAIGPHLHADVPANRLLDRPRAADARQPRTADPGRARRYAVRPAPAARLARLRDRHSRWTGRLVRGPAVRGVTLRRAADGRDPRGLDPAQPGRMEALTVGPGLLPLRARSCGRTCSSPLDPGRPPPCRRSRR